MHYVCDVKVSKIAGLMKKETGTCFVPIFSVGNISGRQAVKALY